MAVTLDCGRVIVNGDLTDQYSVPLSEAIEIYRAADDWNVATGTGRYTVQQLFPGEQDNFVQAIIPGLDRPIAIMIDVDDPEGKKIAGRYRQVLEKTLRSQAYRAILEKFYGRNNIPAGRDEQLNKFIQSYASTWDK
jgi:hypothetical protein